MIVSNAILQWMCKHIYPYLYKDKFNKKIFRTIFNDVKNVFVGKIASYLYLSTDNIIISMFVSTTMVGMLNNYTIITYNIKAIVASALGPIAPSIGNMLAMEKMTDTNKNSEKIFLIYTHIRFMIAAMIVIPLYLLISDFVGTCFGNKFIIEHYLVTLIALDLYINFVYAPCNDYINGLGLFKQDKRIHIIGALLNLGMSLFLVQIIGVQGVLLGTIISLGYFWIDRSRLVFKECLDTGKEGYIRYWIKNLFHILIFLSAILISRVFYNLIDVFFILKFFITGFMCITIYLLMHHIIFYTDDEYRYIQKIVKNMIKNTIIK